jgi:hypothetical protein
MRKITIGLFAVAASLALGATTVVAKDYGDSGGGGGGAGGGQSRQSSGGGGGEKMHGNRGGGESMHRDGGGGEKMRHDNDGGDRVRHRDGDGGRDHRRRGHWRGGIWIYDDYGAGSGGGYCYRWRHECADRWGWGGPGFRRCLRRHGC